MNVRLQRLVGGVLLAAFLLPGCATIEDNPKATAGGALGAAGGGLIAAAAGGGTTGIIGGVLLGGLLGGAVGTALDQRDKELAAQRAQLTFENARTGETGAWRNPDTGNSGTITPTHTYQSTSGGWCREYQQTVTVGGQTQEAFGTACRQPDGSWKIIN
jgi:surface antigen